MDAPGSEKSAWPTTPGEGSSPLSLFLNAQSEHKGEHSREPLRAGESLQTERDVRIGDRNQPQLYRRLCPYRMENNEVYEPYRFQTVLCLLSQAIGGMGDVGWLEQIILHGGKELPCLQ